MGTRKVADGPGAAWDREEKFHGLPHGWVQWKGTDVCMDVHCECGAHLHVDAAFAYNVECPHCGRVFQCNGHIELIEIPKGTSAMEPVMCDRDDDLA